jgi:hypothetical protein
VEYAEIITEKIEKSINFGVVMGFGQAIGGICGANVDDYEGKTGWLLDCINYGAVTGAEEDEMVGGICGINWNAAIEYCKNFGYITGDLYVGGVCGMNEGAISASTNTGPVTGNSGVGGVCGWNGHYETLIACVNAGEVKGNEDVGGVCGGNGNYTTLSASVSSGSVTGNLTMGGVTGYDSSTDSISTCYYSGTGDIGINQPGVSRKATVSEMNVSSVIAALNHAITLWNVKFPKGTVEYCPYHFIPGNPMVTIPPQIAAGAPGTTSVGDGVIISKTKMYSLAGSIYFQSEETIQKIEIYDLNGRLFKIATYLF